MTEQFKSLETKLSVKLPNDYTDFMGQHEHQPFKYFFRVDEWQFWDAKASLSKNLQLRESGTISPQDFAFASAGWEDEEVLFFKNKKGELRPHIYHINLQDNDRDVIFYAFSMSELVNFERREALVKGIKKTGWKNQDLSYIMDCPGSLFWYAHTLMTSKYDNYFSEARNQRALELYFLAAEQGHPEATSEIAKHYFFQDDPDEQKIIEWRERAISLGMDDDAFELADFIVDNNLVAMRGRAIELLEGLMQKPRYHERALTKLSKLYMTPFGGQTDYSRGIELAEQGVGIGYKACFSELAFYYYKGMGVVQDSRKAYELLLQAERLYLDAGIGGFLEPFIRKLAAELGGN